MPEGVLREGEGGRGAGATRGVLKGRIIFASDHFSFSRILVYGVIIVKRLLS